MGHADERRREGVDRESVAVGVAQGECRRGASTEGRKSSEGCGEMDASHLSSELEEEEKERARDVEAGTLSPKLVRRQIGRAHV